MIVFEINVRYVETRKFDCIYFRITGNTDVKKELTGFVLKSV